MCPLTSNAQEVVDAKLLPLIVACIADVNDPEWWVGGIATHCCVHTLYCKVSKSVHAN